MNRPGSGTRAPAWRAIPSTVVALGVVSLLTNLSSEMIYPLLPVFLVEVLGTGAVALGLIEGVAETTAALLGIPDEFLRSVYLAMGLSVPDPHRLFETTRSISSGPFSERGRLPTAMLCSERRG